MTTLTSPQRVRWALAKDTADELTNVFSVPPIPALEIAEENGVNVMFTNFGKYNESVAGYCDFEKRRLYVNSEDQMTRQLFTMAHELGHWLLHREYFLEHPDLYPILPRFQKTDKNNIFEKEANCFAANLLVPKRLLQPLKGMPPAALAEIFIVSRTMMEYRLKNV